MSPGMIQWVYIRNVSCCFCLAGEQRNKLSRRKIQAGGWPRCCCDFSESRSLFVAPSNSTSSFWGTDDNLYITSTYSAKRWHWAEPLGVLHSSKWKGKDGDQGQLLKLTFILLKLKRNDMTLRVDISLWRSSKEIRSFLSLNISMSVLNEVLAMYAAPNWTFKTSSLSVLVLHKRTIKTQFKCGCFQMESLWERGGLVSSLLIF